MSNHRQRLSYLLERYTEKTATPAELQELAALLEKDWQQTEDGSDPLNINWREMLEDILATASAGRDSTPGGRTRMQSFPNRFMKYAALFILIAGAGLWYLARNEKPAPVVHTDIPSANSIVPGRDGAILTLAGGKQIVLDSLGNGVIARQNGSQVILQNGQLLYNPAERTTTTVTYNTMSTPKGRQFNMMLPDGTRIWLNSASSVRYPTVFGGAQREITISGEAYLEVAKDKTRPFIVKAAGMEVEVLGTHFNINAYNDEEAVAATLLEGSVRTSVLNGTAARNNIVLKPGQQARIKHAVKGASEKIEVVDRVAIEKVMAWKNGLFNFEDASLQELMRQIARWYDIEIVFEKGVPDMEFGGKMSRNVELSDVLKALKGSGVHFRIEGRRLVVFP